MNESRENLSPTEEPRRLMSFQLARELTLDEIEMVAGSSGQCTAYSNNQCVEMDC
jgi:hypothetical protein